MVYKAIEGWVCDKHTKVLVKKNFKTMKKFGHIISFVCAKQLLEPI